MEYGVEKLPAGPGVQTSEAIIVVEGRADVLNLLKNNMDNAVAIGGANVPKTLAGLCKQKEVTLFLDGDRGGDIILKEIMSVAEIDYVARAPAGKEVEELSRKEIIKALRSRVPVEQSEGGSSSGGAGGSGSQAPRYEPEKPQGTFRSRELVRSVGASSLSPSRPAMASQSMPTPISRPAMQAPTGYAPRSSMAARPMMPQQPMAAPAPSRPAASQPEVELPMPAVPEELYSSLSELENTARAKLYDKAGALKSEILVKDILPSIEAGSDVHAVVFDGVVTQRLVDLAAKKGIRILLGVKVGNIFNRPSGMFIGGKK
ncbi:DNA primase DnaG [Candidatus Burarchaeum australiense]|nr:DNA primase DnaG [Candidatus Burarchaeum australiense]